MCPSILLTFVFGNVEDCVRFLLRNPSEACFTQPDYEESTEASRLPDLSSSTRSRDAPAHYARISSQRQYTVPHYEQHPESAQDHVSPVSKRVDTMSSFKYIKESLTRYLSLKYRWQVVKLSTFHGYSQARRRHDGLAWLLAYYTFSKFGYTAESQLSYFTLRLFDPT